MIENLRYYINQDKLLIHWNWIGVGEQATANCTIHRRLDDTVISQRDGITMTEYHAGNGGCVFDMPKEPAYIRIGDDPDGRKWTKKIIWEAPAYRLDAKFEKRDEKQGRILVKRKYYFEFKARVLEPMTDERAAKMPGWALVGHYGNGNHTFMMPPLQTRQQTFQEMEVTGSEYNQPITFSTAPELERTRYKRMFLMRGDPSEEQQARQGGEGAQEKISFRTLKAASQNGLYDICCPYCFNKFSADEAVFRANAFEDDSIGYQLETDEKYEAFGTEVEEENVGITRGHVLAWKQEEIQQIVFADAPLERVNYQDGVEKGKIVLMVYDRFGNQATEKLCPHCHHPIPAFSGKYPMVFISMMGDTGSGKSVYLASMLHMLESRNMLPGYGFRVEMLNNIDGKRIRDVYETMIQGKRQAGQTAAQAMPSHAVPQGIPTGFEQASSFDSAINAISQLSAGQGASGFGDIAGGFSFGSGAQDGSSPFGGTPAGTADQPGTPFGGSPFDGPLSGGDAFGGLSFGNDAIGGDLFGGSSPLQSSGPQDQMIDFDAGDALQETAAPNEPDQRSAKLPGATARSYHQPVIYQLTGTDPDNGEKTGVILSFFDFPGEAIRVNVNALYTKNDVYLRKMIDLADGLVFLFDPSTITRVANLNDRQRRGFRNLTVSGMDQAKLASVMGKEPKDILYQFMERYTGGAMMAINKPVAFVISKSDAIRDYLKDADETLEKVDMSFLEESVYTYDEKRTVVPVGEMKENSDKILAFMGDRGLDDAWRSAMGDHPEDGIWIGVSATGVAPDSEGTLWQRHGVPVHVLQPVEWILSRMNNKN